MGRLRPGVTAGEVRSQLERNFHESALEIDGRSLDQPLPSSWQPGQPIDPLPTLVIDPGEQGLREARRTYHHSIQILTGLVVLVLMIACVNVASLLVARAAARRREFAVRLALGASRARLIRQLVTESLLLALAGAVVGIAFAYWGKDVLLGLRPTDGPALVLDLAVNGRVLGFTIIIAMVTGVFFGLAPAVRATRVDLNIEFQSGSRNRGSNRATSARSLIAIQIALSVVLLVGAAMFVRTLRNLQHVDVGFNRDGLLVFRVDATATGKTYEQAVQFYQRLNERLAGVPGVTASTFSRQALLNREGGRMGGSVSGIRMGPGAKTVGGNLNSVAPSFFDTFEIPIVLGRGFDARDGIPSNPVVIVNQALVREFYPNQNPLGQRTTFGEIVGVAADAKQADLRSSVESAAYVPMAPSNPLTNFGGEANFAIRTSGDALALAEVVRRTVWGLEPRLPLFDMRTQEQQVARLLEQERMFASLSGFFGLLGAGLVCVGLYGLMSYAVVRRTNEIGIRMALGALPRWVLWMILRESLGLACVGVVMGLAGAAAASKLISSLLFGLSPTDPSTYALAALLLLGVAAVACLLPARRAARVDPMVALRCE